MNRFNEHWVDACFVFLGFVLIIAAIVRWAPR